MILTSFGSGTLLRLTAKRRPLLASTIKFPEQVYFPELPVGVPGKAKW
jgi:hypothetical protein